MLESKIEFFDKEKIQNIIHECLIYPNCKIAIVELDEYKLIQLNKIIIEMLDKNLLARKPFVGIIHSETRIYFTNGSELRIVARCIEGRHSRMNKIYCNSKIPVEVYFENLLPKLRKWEKMDRD